MGKGADLQTRSLQNLEDTIALLKGARVYSAGPPSHAQWIDRGWRLKYFELPSLGFTGICGQSTAHLFNYR